MTMLYGLCIDVTSEYIKHFGSDGLISCRLNKYNKECGSDIFNIVYDEQTGNIYLMYKLAELENDDELSLKDFVTDMYQNQNAGRHKELIECYEYIFSGMSDSFKITDFEYKLLISQGE